MKLHTADPSWRSSNNNNNKAEEAAALTSLKVTETLVSASLSVQYQLQATQSCHREGRRVCYSKISQGYI